MPDDAARPILIFGPTASGKSALALALARRLGGAVLNADALQVYDGWRTLTARPSPEETAAVPHRLYGHVPLERPYSVGEWLAEARGALELCARNGWRPVLVGGTGLYFRALTTGLAEAPPPTQAARAEAEAALARLGREAMAEALARRDPETAARIDLANPARLLRAWEALHEGGAGLAALWARTPPPLLDLRACVALRLDPDRAALYARIDARFDGMLAGGALDEARAVAARRPEPTAPGLKALGARELLDHLAGRMTLAEAAERAKRASRAYAKRQLTWGRNQMPTWTTLSGPDLDSALALADAPVRRAGERRP